MNARILIIEFALFSCGLNMLIAWSIFDDAGADQVSTFRFLVDALVSSVLIVFLTSLLVTLSSRRMLRVKRLRPINIEFSGGLGLYIKKPIVRLFLLGVVMLFVMNLFLFSFASFFFKAEISTVTSLYLYVVYCGLIGLIFTPMVALNWIVCNLSNNE